MEKLNFAKVDFQRPEMMEMRCPIKDCSGVVVLRKAKVQPAAIIKLEGVCSTCVRMHIVEYTLTQIKTIETPRR